MLSLALGYTGGVWRVGKFRWFVCAVAALHRASALVVVELALGLLAGDTGCAVVPAPTPRIRIVSLTAQCCAQLAAAIFVFDQLLDLFSCVLTRQRVHVSALFRFNPRRRPAREQRRNKFHAAWGVP